MHVVRHAAVMVVAAFLALGLAAPAHAQEICTTSGLATAGTTTLTAFPTGSGATASLAVAGAQLGQPAISADSTTAYVPDAAGDRLIVVAAGTLTQSTAIALPAGSGPTKVVLSPTRPRAYVLNAAARTVSIVDTTTRQVVATTAALDGASPLADLAIAPGGGTLYALTAASAQVRLHLLPATADAVTPTSTVPVGAMEAHALAVTSTRVVVAITTAGGVDTLQVLDAAGTAVDTGSTDLGGVPTALAVSADGATAYLATDQPRLFALPLSTLVAGTGAVPAGRVGAIAVGPGGAVYAAETSAIGVYTVAGSRSGAIANVAGTGVALCPSTATIPGAPTALCLQRGDRAIGVAMTAPASDGGAPITAYEIVSTPDGATCTATSADGCVVGGLRNGVGYTFAARARNAVGWGPWSLRSVGMQPRRDTGARTLDVSRVTVRTTRRAVVLSARVTTTGPGLIAQSALVKGKRYCASSRRVTGAGTFLIRCTVKGAGRRLVRQRATTFLVRTTFTPTFGSLAANRQDVRAPRRR